MFENSERKKGRPKIEDAKIKGVHIRLTVKEKERLDMCKKEYGVTAGDILELGLYHLICGEGEAGEAIDILKKHLFQGHDLD